MKIIHFITGNRHGVTLAVAAVGAAGLILLGGVLPAEFGIDPLRLGKMTGISRLYVPNDGETTFKPSDGPAINRSYPTAWRIDVIDIPLDTSLNYEKSELEYKVAMESGETIVYSWQAITADGKPAGKDDVYSEFHGQTPADPQKLAKNEKLTVAYYRKAMGPGDNGMLTAPFDGIHGWYLQNQSEKPLTIRLRLAGYYRLIPPNAPGNEIGILPSTEPAT